MLILPIFDSIKDDSEKVVEVVAELLTDYKYIYLMSPSGRGVVHSFSSQRDKLLLGCEVDWR